MNIILLEKSIASASHPSIRSICFGSRDGYYDFGPLLAPNNSKFHCNFDYGMICDYIYDAGFHGFFIVKYE